MDGSENVWVVRTNVRTTFCYFFHSSWPAARVQNLADNLMLIRANVAPCFHGRHLSPEHLNHWPPSVAVPGTASVRADWLPHHPAPVIERSVCLSVRQTGDDTVVANLTPLFALGSGWLLRNPVAESLENLFLTAENPSKSLSSHIGPQPKSDEASAGKFRVVCRGKCTVWHSHL